MTAKSSLNNEKYRHSEYEDGQIDGLMRYFRLQDYSQLKWLLRGMKKRAMTTALIFVNCDVNQQETIRDRVGQVAGVRAAAVGTAVATLNFEITNKGNQLKIWQSGTGILLEGKGCTKASR